MACLNDIYRAIDDYAPKSLSDEYCAKYGAYDNSGILIDGGRRIDKAVCSLDFSGAAVERAKREGAQLIFTHHPAIYGKISDLRIGDPLGKKLLAAIESGVSVVSMHLNMDCAREGIDYYLMKGVLSSAGQKVEDYKIFEPLSEEKTGYGRSYSLNGVSFSALVNNMKKTFSSDRIVAYGEEKNIKKCASFCGAGADEKAVCNAYESGADVVVSSDFKHHILALATELHLNVICLTHYASENYGFQKITEKIMNRAGLPFLYHTDTHLL